MNNDLKISKEKVLEAAAACPQAKKTLEVLFPEAFNIHIDLSPGVKIRGNNIFVGPDALISVSKGLSPPNLSHKCFILWERYAGHDIQWSIMRYEGTLFLIPVKKAE